MPQALQAICRGRCSSSARIAEWLGTRSMRTMCAPTVGMRHKYLPPVTTNSVGNGLDRSETVQNTEFHNTEFQKYFQNKYPLQTQNHFRIRRGYCFRAIPHNSKCRYGERGAADAKPKAQIILDAAKVSAASGGCSEPKQGQRSQSARGFCPRSTMRVPQPDIIEHFGNADAVPQPPERCLSRQAGIVRCCLKSIRNEK